MSSMRAKLRIYNVKEWFHEVNGVNTKTQETLYFNAVGAPRYEGDGADENNTYARFTPSADLTIQVANPALFDQFKAGQVFYVDFTEVDA